MPVIVNAETGATIDLDFAERTLMAHGRVTLAFDGFSLATTITYTQRLRPNGTKVTFIALDDTDFAVGDAGSPLFQVNDAAGFVVLTPLGMAAELTVPAITIAIGEDFSFTAGLSVKINNTNKKLDETFVIPGVGPKTISMPAGPYLRIEATDVAIALKGFEFAADGIAIEQVTTKPATATTPAVKVTRFVASGVEASFGADQNGTKLFSLTEGLLVLVLYPGLLTAGGGVAGIASGRIRLQGGGVVDVQGDAILQINRTNRVRAESVPVAGSTASFNLAAGTFSVVGRNVSIRILDLFELTGDYFTETRNGRTIYGARNATLFLGQRNSDDLTDFSNAVGVRITEANVAVVRFDNGNGTLDDTYAVSAYGRAELLGIPGLEVTGTLRVRINHTGQAFTEIVLLPAIANATDDDGDGTADEPGEGDGVDDPGNPNPAEAGEEGQIVVSFANGTRVETFEVGVDPFGNADPAKRLHIDGGNGIFVLDGILRFTRQPNGRLEVEAPAIDVTISVPMGAGNLQEIVKVSGVARFSLGGVGGFQLQDLRPNGLALFGQTIIASTTPSLTQLRPVEADLAGPFPAQNVKASYFNAAAQPYIDIVFRDPNFQGINRESIIDDDDEFTFIGAAASNVAVNGAAVEVGPNVYRYFLSKKNDALDLFRPAGAGDPRNTVRIEFRLASFANVFGATNKIESESFYVSFATIAPFGVADDQLAAPVASATLTSPFAGATLSQRSASSRPWIDVVFTPVNGGKIVGISGDEVRISGPGAANLKLKQGTSYAEVGAPTLIAPNTYRYYVTPKPGVSLAQIWANGTVDVEIVGALQRRRALRRDLVRGRADVERHGLQRRHRRGRHGRHLVLLVHGRLDAAGRRPDRRPDRDRPADADQPGRQPRRHHLQGRQARADDRHRRRQRRPRLRPHQLDRRARPRRAPRRRAAASRPTSPASSGTFDVRVDLAQGRRRARQPRRAARGLRRPGQVHARRRRASWRRCPNVVVIAGSGLRVSYDENYDPAKNAGKAQEILRLNSASVTFPRFGITGLIQPLPGRPATRPTDRRPDHPGPRRDDRRLRDRPRRAALQARQRQVVNTTPVATVPDHARPRPAAAADQHDADDPADRARDHDRLQRHPRVRRPARRRHRLPAWPSRTPRRSTATIYFASGGARFLPGKPISATITDRLDARAGGDGAGAEHRGRARVGRVRGRPVHGVQVQRPTR